jgi:hypothetical protein
MPILRGPKGSWPVDAFNSADPNAAGAVAVKVTVAGNSGSLTNGFTYVVPARQGFMPQWMR